MMMEQLLQSTPSWTNVAIFFAIGVGLLLVVLGFVTYGILAERKVMGFMQGRIIRTKLEDAGVAANGG